MRCKVKRNLRYLPVVEEVRFWLRAHFGESKDGGDIGPVGEVSECENQICTVFRTTNFIVGFSYFLFFVRIQT